MDRPLGRRSVSATAVAVPAPFVLLFLGKDMQFAVFYIQALARSAMAGLETVIQGGA